MTIKINFDLYIDIVEMPLHLMTAEEASLEDSDNDESTIASAYSDDSSFCNYYDGMDFGELDCYGDHSEDIDGPLGSSLFDFMDRLDALPRQSQRGEENDSINLANTRGIRRLPRSNRILIDEEENDDDDEGDYFQPVDQFRVEAYAIPLFPPMADDAATVSQDVVDAADIDSSNTNTKGEQCAMPSPAPTRRRRVTRRTSSGCLPEDSIKDFSELLLEQN